MTKLSRRDFIKVAGVSLGAATLTCSGLTALTSRQPEIELTDTTYGENKMNGKILVAYASRTGSTSGVADAVGKTLAEAGLSVEVRPVQEIKDLVPYQAVIVGSAIRGRKWLPEAMEFLETHRAILSRKPCAAFMVCITLAMRGGENYRQGVAEWMDPVRRMVRPVSEGLFAGALDCSQLGMVDGLKMRAAVAAKIFPAGDHRDWNAIRAWAENLHPLLIRKNS